MNKGIHPFSLFMIFFLGCVESVEFTPLPPDVPVLRHPINDTYIGSKTQKRPHFQWDGSGQEREADNTFYELQYTTDKFFAEDITIIKTSDNIYQPNEDLPILHSPPVGNRYYWRVRACRTDEPDCSDYSEIRWFNLGRLSNDFNGDGYSDIAVGAPGFLGSIGHVYIYFGGANGTFDTAADVVLTNSVTGGFYGTKVVTAQDFNADGYSDLLVSSERANPTGAVYLYYGRSGEFSNVPADITFSVGVVDDIFGRYIAPAGDFNADGFADFLALAPNATTSGSGTGRAYIFYGGVTGARDLPRGVVNAPPGIKLSDLASVGDINGDGRSDIVVDGRTSDENSSINDCSSDIFFGEKGEEYNPILIENIPRRTTLPKCTARSIPLGDANKDGFTDLVSFLRGLNRDHGELLLGADDFNAVAATEIDLEYFQEIAAGDFNGDGVVDFAAILDTPDQAAVILLGKGPLLSISATRILRPTLPSSTPNPRIVNAGDLNGDGFSDIAISAAYDLNNIGHVYIYLSDATGNVDEIIDGTLEGMSGFGASISYSIDAR